jgi:quinoprotein glucose dehydrogenase
MNVRTLKLVVCFLSALCIEAADVDWPSNGGPYNIRYSELRQINRENVTRLQVAWAYDAHDAFKDSEMQSNPIIVDGILYATTPKLRVIALNAQTGREIWSFNPNTGDQPLRRYRHRGVNSLQGPRFLHLSQLSVGSRPSHR